MNNGDRAEADEHDPEQRRGQPHRIFALPLLQEFREHRHECRRQRRLSEELRDVVGHLVGDRERGGEARGSEVAREHDFAKQPHDA
jgi:hypothetical protein